MMFAVLFAVFALDSLTFCMTFPIMSPFIFSLGGTQFELGLMGSCCALVTLIWNPIAGSLSDTHGRKTMLLCVLAVCVVSNVALLAADSLWPVIITRMTASLGCPIVALIKTLIADSVPSLEEQTKIISNLQAMGGLFFIIGPLLGGFIGNFDKGITYLFIIISMLNLTCMVLVSFLPSLPRKVEKSHDKEDKSVLSMSTFEITKTINNLKNIDWGLYNDIFLVKLCAELSYGIWQMNLSFILIQYFGATNMTLGYIFAFMGIIGIITQLSLIKLNRSLFCGDKLGYSRILTCLTLLVVGFGSISFITNFYLYILCFVPLIIARSMLDSTLNEKLLSKASSEAKGGIVGAYDSIVSFAGLTTPILSAAVSYFVGIHTAVLLCIVPLSVGYYITYSYKTKEKTV